MTEMFLALGLGDKIVVATEEGGLFYQSLKKAYDKIPVRLKKGITLFIPGRVLLSRSGFRFWMGWRNQSRGYGNTTGAYR